MTRDLALTASAEVGGMKRARVARSCRCCPSSWFWACTGKACRRPIGYTTTQPEALAAALAHIRTYHQPQETK